MTHLNQVTKKRSLDITKPLEFNDYFLQSRLKRVPISVLKQFVLELVDPAQGESFGKPSQAKLVETIFSYYKLRQNKPDFIIRFNKFIRDHLFSAKESVYLLQVPSQTSVINWIKNWSNNKYIGHRHNFSMHTAIQLEERFLQIDENKTASFPSEVLLIIASSKAPKHIASGLKLVEYFPTVEIELIFRQHSNLMEARGDISAIRDFVNTAILDSQNPLSMASSFFVGDREDAQQNSITDALGKVVKIDKLKKSLNGKYLSVSAPVKGDKTSRIQADFEELDDFNEETDPVIQPVLLALINDQDRSRISFQYCGQKYSFGITKKGGLTFKQYAPEEVVTYV